MGYLEEQEKCGLKVGDTVKILRKAERREKGWEAYWTAAMDKFVGKTGEIQRKSGVQGFCVLFENIYDSYLFPYFVLEKVENTETPKHKEKFMKRFSDKEIAKALRQTLEYMDSYANELRSRGYVVDIVCTDTYSFSLKETTSYVSITKTHTEEI